MFNSHIIDYKVEGLYFFIIRKTILQLIYITSWGRVTYLRGGGWIVNAIFRLYKNLLEKKEYLNLKYMHVNRNFSLLNISLHINKSCMKNGHFINHPAFLFDKCYFYDKDSVMIIFYMYEQLSKSGNSNLNKRFFKILGYLPLASCSINQIFFGPVDNQPIPPLRIKKGQMGGS